MIDIHPFIINIAQASTEAAANSEASNGVLGTLGISWGYFVAQLVNFGIVLFVLWKWVFTPVANKLTERTEKIEKAMRDANTVEKEKQEFAVWKEHEMTKARQEASSIINAAQKDAGLAKDDILKKAKEEQEKMVMQAKAQIEQEKNSQLQSAKQELADMITNATEKIIRFKLDEKKDKELIKETLKNI